MPPTPFPYQLGIGTDIVHTLRIKNLLLKPEPNDRYRNLNRYLGRFLTYREYRAFWDRFHSRDTSQLFTEKYLEYVTRYLAGRWAAKEATIKAAHWRNLSFKHIQILNRNASDSNTGKVYALILEKPASAFSASRYVPEGKKSVLPSDSTGSDGEQHDGTDHETEAPSEQDDGAPPAGAPHPLESDVIDGGVQFGDLPGQIARISISHDGEYATAVCLAAEEPRTGDVGGEAAAREP